MRQLTVSATAIWNWAAICLAATLKWLDARFSNTTKYASKYGSNRMPRPRSLVKWVSPAETQAVVPPTSTSVS